jgi:hypothetical protein
VFEALLLASGRIRMLGSAASGATTLRLLGVLLSAGVLLGTALGLARAAARQGSSDWSARRLVRGLLLTSPVLAVPVVAVATLPKEFDLGAFMGLLSLLALAFFLMGALVAPTLGSPEHRTAQLATGALWTGGLGVLAGCVGLGATAYAGACVAASNVNPVDMLFLLNEHAHQLGAMKKVTGVAILVCTLPPTLLAVHAARRGARGLGPVMGMFGALLLVPLLLTADALAAKYIDNQLSLNMRTFTIPPGYEPVRMPGADVLDEYRATYAMDADVILTLDGMRFSYGEPLPLDVLDEEKHPLLEQQLSVLSRKEEPWGPTLSVAVDARVSARVVARFLEAAQRAGAQGLRFVGRGTLYDEPTYTKAEAAVLANVPSLATVLEVPLDITTWLAAPDSGGTETRRVMRARLSGEGPFTVSAADGEGLRFEVVPSRPSSPSNEEPDTVRGLGLSDGPAPVVWLDAGSAPSTSSLLVAAAALRVRGFEVALTP